eukprot:GHVU01072823.1.p1 GENE.GHVU01072823.1~~GHVU01072823.1.p1  ORF type:complete len:110 (+),score=4.56 GHVU01072823.1:1173-1502(+)
MCECMFCSTGIETKLTNSSTSAPANAGHGGGNSGIVPHLVAYRRCYRLCLTASVSTVATDRVYPQRGPPRFSLHHSVAPTGQTVGVSEPPSSSLSERHTSPSSSSISST